MNVPFADTSCKVIESEKDDPHAWSVVVAHCDLDNPEDGFVEEIVALVRRSYGENDLVEAARFTLEAEITAGEFQIEHLIAAIRLGLPNPAAEGEKPVALTNFRSQSAEMVAKAALAAAYAIEYPAAPQAGAPNPNMPILGFDGWGLQKSETGEYVFVLIQVKATDSPDSPPAEAKKLALECTEAPRSVSALSRALSLLASLLRGHPLQAIVLKMLTQLGRNEPLKMQIAPAIVRGQTVGKLSDLEPIRQKSQECAPAVLKGAVVSIGVPLDKFGRLVMQNARSQA